MVVRAIREATQVEYNSRNDILHASVELVAEVLRRNSLSTAASIEVAG
ncbi:MAG: Chorismate mutase type [Pseudonocardiales bacterium]|jgi:chorismate mutase|nr:Chorismate mutase type [Pseudonocardiales bacterium]